MTDIASTGAEALRVRLVVIQDGWILPRFAHELKTHLTPRGVAVDIGDQPDPAADVNHFINYLVYKEPSSTIDTLMITHLDVPQKYYLVANQLRDAHCGICMSRAAVEQLKLFGVGADRLDFVNPGRNEELPVRKIGISICTRLYPDGRKREHLLDEVSKQVPPQFYRFFIMGNGWDTMVDNLRARGFEVLHWSEFSMQAYYHVMGLSDYYLYLGMDEGSMSFVDALACGVETIATPQGFHLDVTGGITHSFVTADDLKAVFDTIREKRARLMQSVESWTWENYALKHLDIWRALVARR